MFLRQKMNRNFSKKLYQEYLVSRLTLVFLGFFFSVYALIVRVSEGPTIKLFIRGLWFFPRQIFFSHETKIRFLFCHEKSVIVLQAIPKYFAENCSQIIYLFIF